jgi:hypothetical protein
MASIGFFVPVIFNSQIKTTSQQILEIVDEYFYFGNKCRVNISPPDENHPKFWATYNYQDCSRSWVNIAIKVVSYCILILPLLALSTKAILRSYFQISSIPVEEKILSNLEKLPPPLMDMIIENLNFQSQKQLFRTSPVISKTMRTNREQLMKSMTRFKKEIDALPKEPISPEKFQLLLVRLISSPAAGKLLYWTRVMDALMEYMIIPDSTIDEVIQKHATIAKLLAASRDSISSDQFNKFYKYLKEKQLEPWIGYRILEQYLLKLNPSDKAVEEYFRKIIPSIRDEGIKKHFQKLKSLTTNEDIEKYLHGLMPTFTNEAIKEYLRELKPLITNETIEEYLMSQAKELIIVKKRTLPFSKAQALSYLAVDVDPRLWWGFNYVNSSLWIRPGNDEMAPMPEIFLKVLWTHIQSLRDLSKPFEVSMIRRTEANFPQNFTLKLAKYFTNSEMFLNHNGTIDKDALQDDYYGSRLTGLNKEERKKLAQRYPEAIVSDLAP